MRNRGADQSDPIPARLRRCPDTIDANPRRMRTRQSRVWPRGLAALALAVSAAGCSIQPHSPVEPVAQTAISPPVEIWEYPAAAFPATCMVFGSDGSLQFRGGFLFFNTGRWSRNAATGVTHLVLGGEAAFPIEPVLRQKRDYVAASHPFDPRTRTLRYRISAADSALEFAGLIFHRSATCSAA